MHNGRAIASAVKYCELQSSQSLCGKGSPYFVVAFINSELMEECNGHKL